MGTSIAVPAISPSPIAAWPSPKYSSAAGNVDGQIQRVADGRFGRVHVAAEFGGNDGAAGFAVGGSDADAAEKRVQRNFHFVI